MVDKTKCQGCGAETTSDVGWCLACRSILYTDLQIAKSDFRGSEFKTMVFPVRDVIWLQERLRLRDAEIKAMDTVNDEMGVTILSLRAALAEAERKLAVSEKLRAAASQSGNEVAKSTLDYYAMEKRKARTYEKLAASYTAIASRQRRTIRALVVAARALRQAGWKWRWRGLTTDFMVLDVRARVAQIRLQEKLNSEQAGKE